MSDKLAAFREASTLPDLPDDDTPLRGNGKLPAWHLHLTCLAHLSPYDFQQLVLLWQEFGPSAFVWESILVRRQWSVEFGPGHGGRFVADLFFGTKREAMTRADQVMRSEQENRR